MSVQNIANIEHLALYPHIKQYITDNKQQQHQQQQPQQGYIKYTHERKVIQNTYIYIAIHLFKYSTITRNKVKSKHENISLNSIVQHIICRYRP